MLALMDAGKNQEAVEIFRDLIKKDSQNARYYIWLGHVLHKLGRGEEALDAAQGALELEPDNAFYHDHVDKTKKLMNLQEEK